MNYEATVTDERVDYVPGEGLPGDTAKGHDGGELEGQKPGMSRGLLIGVFAVLALGAAIIAYFVFATGEPEAAADDNSQAPVVTVVNAGQTTVQGIIEVPGTIAARREMPVGVEGEGGRVVSVPVDAGEWVSAGQTLAVIDRTVQTQQAQAQAAQIEVAKADANLAQANLDRALQLVERGFVSKADVDRLTATRDSAQARVRVAEAQLAELRARNARLRIFAPAAGYVLERNVEPGQSVGPGAPALFRIARSGEMEMLAQVSESQLAGLSQGVNASVIPAGSEKSFNGQVWQLSPVVDTTTRQGTARIALPFAPELRPGGFATAQIMSGTMTATVLPESAVLADEEGPYVYIVTGENKIERRAIKTGAVTPDGVAITDGLAGGEAVVLRSGGFRNPGETVRPRREGEPIGGGDSGDDASSE
ncbi:efflux RND transporter periplasmic adaptor subunit [Erythrobacter sp. YT30]|uniref:efflux RND transporter periplasmic adaptor subunit n=1 Tax=Erythrobacter sp. YT30 TaxID=1735012 RepID=UPI00076C8485|nr:efflux RND transporter periplasmic adaptor subunit [Erythrobacter sp. YT30]KWV91347.1 secretion protein HylD [Erythrobacter sp. YT30]